MVERSSHAPVTKQWRPHHSLILGYVMAACGAALVISSYVDFPDPLAAHSPKIIPGFTLAMYGLAVVLAGWLDGKAVKKRGKR